MARKGRLAALSSAFIFSVIFVISLWGCDLWNKDMLGYLEHWSETVQMGRVEVTGATIQKNDSGVDTISLSATPTIAVYVINPKSYELLAEIGDSSSSDRSVRISSQSVQTKAQVVAHESTMLKIQLGSADGSLEHTEFRVDFEAIRKDTMQSSGQVMGVTLQYNTPPVAPTPVVWNYDSRQHEVVKAGEKWEADRDGILYWAYDDSITKETDPNCAKWFSINGTRHPVADCNVPGVQVDGLSVFQFKTNYGGTSVTAVDSEGVSSPAVASGQAVPPATYVIKYDANGATGGTAPTSQNKTQYTDITLATNSGGLTRIGYRFSGWNTAPAGTGTTYSAGATYSADEGVTLYAQWEYQLRDSVQVLAEYSSPHHPSTGSWKYVEFGYWPQTVKAADVTVDKSKSKSMGMFTYYLGSDDNWYVEAKENAHGNGIEYRYSNGEQAGQGGTTTKWFKVEPIVWRVLTENYIDADVNGTGNALLLAESILTGGIKWADSKNDYMESNIRKWLNGNNGTGKNSDYNGTPGFLQTAFTADAQSLIADTTVGNSPASTNPASDDKYWNHGVNEYAFGKTKDKVFLLSQQEATYNGYGFGGFKNYDSTRIRVTTDYAKATGAYQADGSGGRWWLRSPFFSNDRCALNIDNYGYADSNSVDVYYTNGGVVPALCIPVSELP